MVVLCDTSHTYLMIPECLWWLTAPVQYQPLQLFHSPPSGVKENTNSKAIIINNSCQYYQNASRPRKQIILLVNLNRKRIEGDLFFLLNICIYLCSLFSINFGLLCSKNYHSMPSLQSRAITSTKKQDKGLSGKTM